MVNTTCLSHPLSSSTPLYGGKGKIEFTPDKCLASGDTCNSFHLSFPNHSSTHVDMPFHFLTEGKRITDVPASFWIFSAVAVLDFPLGSDPLIDFDPRQALDEKLCEKADILLIRTGFERHRGTEQYWANGPGLSSKLAARLKEAMPHLRAVGIDFISISSFRNRDEGRAAHREFLKREILLIEDMKLSALNGLPTLLTVSPLLAEGLDGAPATVFALYEGVTG